MHPNISREVWILVGVAAASLLLGTITGYPFLVAALGFGLYITTMLRHLGALQRWLLERDQREIPEAEGIWGDVFNEIRKLVKQSERREDHLAGMVERFQSAAGAMPEAVVILSLHDEIEWANTLAAQLIGVHYPRDAGLRLGNLLRNPEFARYLSAAAFPEPLEMPSPANREITISLQIIPFGAHQKLVLARDVTRLSRLEQTRRIFVANVSHELRTPLTVLAGYVETLRDMPKTDREDLDRHLATMQEQTGRMQRLVEDLLTLSRLETAPPTRRDETLDVPRLLRSLQEQATVLSGSKRHQISLRVEEGLCLLGSQEELTSAFSNLVSNAVRYTPEGGAIALTWQREGDGARFCVTDSGVGIAPEHIPHLTERFYRVDTARSRATGGTGLGLSIVKHVLLRHDARLAIDSELGRGSTFCCVFPASRLVVGARGASSQET